MRLFLSFVVFLSIFMQAQVEGMGMEKQSEAQRPVIILLGPPGSGKGTQATDLSQRLSLPHISTGDLFRHHFKNTTSLGKKAQEYSSKGLLVPDELVLDMVAERVTRNDCHKGYILDGFPRTLPQAQGYEKLLEKEQTLIVVNLEVADGQITKRLTGRLMCRDCGQIFHKSFSPPKHAGICDMCEGELYQREDDSPQVVQNRLEVYHKQTKPLITFYQQRGNLVAIDGDQEKSKVLAQVLEQLAHRGVHAEALH